MDALRFQSCGWLVRFHVDILSPLAAGNVSVCFVTPDGQRRVVSTRQAGVPTRRLKTGGAGRPSLWRPVSSGVGKHKKSITLRTLVDTLHLSRARGSQMNIALRHCLSLLRPCCGGEGAAATGAHGGWSDVRLTGKMQAVQPYRSSYFTVSNVVFLQGLLLTVVFSSRWRTCRASRQS